MTLQQKVKELDRLVIWGYNQGKISGKLLEGFLGVIKDLAEYDAQETAEPEDTPLKTVQELLTLRTVARMNGLTPKALARIEEMDEGFLNWFAQYGFNINTNLLFEAFLALYRGINTRVETDLGNIAWYAQLRQLSQASPASHVFQPSVEFMRETYPHLSRWFSLIDQGADINEMEANDQLYSYYLKN